MTVTGMRNDDKVSVERKKHKGCDITRKYQKILNNKKIR